MIYCVIVVNNFMLLYEFLLVLDGIVVNVKILEGIILLMLVCEKNYFDVVLFLLKRGVIVDEKFDKGLMVVYFCVLLNDIVSLYYFIDYKVDLIKVIEWGSIVFMFVCVKGYVFIVIVLLCNVCKFKLKSEFSLVLKFCGLVG